MLRLLTLQDALYTMSRRCTRPNMRPVRSDCRCYRLSRSQTAQTHGKKRHTFHRSPAKKPRPCLRWVIQPSSTPSQSPPMSRRHLDSPWGPVAAPSAGHSVIGPPESGSAVTEVRLIPRPVPSSSPPSARHRLYYPFLVGTIGGLCGLLLAMVGLRIIKQQRDRAELSRVEQRTAREQLLEQAVRALVMGRPQEARTLLFEFNHRWPTP
jgi:hypothetical protein